MSSFQPISTFPTAWKQKLRRKLLAWFGKHARDLPWRQTRQLYHVWISEIMLQQTQVATVVPYFKRFIERFPDVHALAAASEEEVLRMWEGLGYYRRARQLHHAAQIIADRYGGKFPRDVALVRELPGIGRYTAGAILSIALDAREPILEANTIRVLSRLSAYRDDPTRSAGQRHLWSLAESLLPRKRVGDFNQAMMELGSEVCKPKSPDCDNCPLADLCPTELHGLHDIVPAPKKKTQYEDAREAAVIVRHGDKILLRRCGPDERWSGLWDFPRFAVAAHRGAALRSEMVKKVAEQTGLVVETGRRLTTLKHDVTRFRITLLCHEARYLDGQLQESNGPIQWVDPEQLDQLPLSVTGRKISLLLQQQTEKVA